MIFADPFDEALAKSGPAALFTLSHQGELRVDVMKSRELWRQNQGPFLVEACHCVLIDHETNWPQYALITSPQLCIRHERASIERYPAYEEALQAVEQYKKAYYQRQIS